LITALAGLAGLLIGAICLLIVYDVIARNLGWQPPDSTVALTEYALLYFTMAAAPWLVRRRGHIVVEVFHQQLPPRARRTLQTAIPLLCAMVSFVIATLAALLALEAFARGEVEIRSLDAPRWILFMPISIGFALMALEFIRLLMLGESVFPDTSGSGGRQQSF
jgi:TRAP-type C4-dicarboxylate transport system permease small subunit